MKYLTLFTIGPVQSFIAQARKLQDLYAGSFLLSHLTMKTMHEAKQLGAEILFPSPYQESSPNRFLMTIEVQSIEELSQKCEELERFVRNYWEEIAKKVIDKTKLSYSSDVAAQISAVLQVFYASDKYIGGADFSECYINATVKRLGAAKKLRAFQQLDEPYGRKCNLSHEHNALFYREYRKYLTPAAQKVTKRNVGDIDKYLQNAEALGAAAFVKRCLNYAIPDFNTKFPSVSNIACEWQLDQFLKKNPEQVNKYLDDIDHIRKEPAPLFADEDEPVQSFYSDVRQVLRDSNIKLTPYYAVVMFDGDDMGKWYSEPEICKTEIESFQRTLSGHMSSFADKQSRVVIDWNEKKNGVVIYAGGEDFLGAINLSQVFPALQLLRETFGKINLSPYTEEKLSFSAGAVIAHVKTPLSEVLKLVREAEYKAKNFRDEKDAYCLTIVKHSGGYDEFVLPFYTDEQNTLTILEELVSAIVNESISTKFIYQLSDELERLSEIDNKALQYEIFHDEAKRLLEHSGIPNENKKATITEICDQLKKLTVVTPNLKNLLHFMRGVAFIARERGAER